MRHNRRDERVLGATLLILSALLYGRGLAAPPWRANEGVIETQAVGLVAHGGHDREGRALPLFVHADGDLWLSPLPVYATAVLMKLVPSASAHARWAAAIFGVIDGLLFYLLAVRWFRRPAVGFMAALVLLITPSHAFFSRTATLEGIWQVPFILGWAIGMTALTDRRSPRARWILAAGAASLAASAYTQPSAALMAPLFAIVSVVIFCRADGWRIRDGIPAGVAFVALLLPLLVWYARFPGTYPDTFGRWVLHPAHLRNPIVWMQALSNWHRLANTAALFWDFFVPSHLFLTPDAPGLCGMFLSLTVVPMVCGVVALVRTADTKATIERMRPVIISACTIGPLAAAMFETARADGRALITVPFGILVAAWGATVMWDGGAVRRGILVASLAGVAIQALLCLR